MLAVALWIVVDAVQAEGKLPKNIVLILADDLGIEGLGCYGGSDYPTPNLDKLAAEGLRFTHAYSQPLCSPTRLELMTGRDNHRNWTAFGILPKGEKTFGHLMQGFGYKTCIAGKWQLTSYDPPDFPNAALRRDTGTHPKDAGFDAYALYHAEETEDKGSRYADPTFLQDGELHDAVNDKYGEDIWVQFIADFMKEHREERMFVYYPMALPHWPMVPTPHSPVWTGDPSRRLEEDTKYFPDMVAYMDTLIGRLVEEIDALGLREDTLILFYSDNGTDTKITSHLGEAEVRGGKGSPQQSGIRVPLIANWPRGIRPGTNSDLVEPSDFIPTLAGLAGQPMPKDWPTTDGVSFAPPLLGGKGTPRDWAFFWYDPRPGWDKEKFTRSIFALDHDFKLFSDGRMFDIAGETMHEAPLDLDRLSPAAEKARAKLKAAIEEKMRPPLAPAARIEVDAFGDEL